MVDSEQKPTAVSEEMLQIAMKKAVEVGLLPRSVDAETYLKNWAGMNSVLQAVMAATK